MCCLTDLVLPGGIPFSLVNLTAILYVDSQFAVSVY